MSETMEEQLAAGYTANAEADRAIAEEMMVTEPIEGEVTISETKPWERIKNRKVRREQEFLDSVDTSIGSRVEMSDRIYKVTKTGWRKL